MSAQIGRCSLCGGRVTLPELWGGLTEPKGICESCGAVERDRSRVIPMQPRSKPVFAEPPVEPYSPRRFNEVRWANRRTGVLGGDDRRDTEELGGE
jgi:hypothetical protein